MSIKERLRRLEQATRIPSSVLYQGKMAEAFRSLLSTDIEVNEALKEIAELNKNRP